MIIGLIILAIIISSAAYPLALRFAKKHNIVDNPDARKLQKEPIPVLGGIVAVVGMLIPLIIAAQYYRFDELWYIICAIIFLWFIGTMDDVRGLPAWMRFALETILIWIFIWHPNAPESGMMINSLHGTWGRDMLSPFTAIPLTLLAGVGIINAINLIDGVDGYSSGFGIVASTLFGLIFLRLSNPIMAIFSFVTAASLTPFFLHNVFGKKSKMFVGDGGSLVIGLVLTYDVFALLCSPTPAQRWVDNGLSIVALALAILCIPVFDTLRVMIARIIRGDGPFSPDKTHLHHLYIDMGFSHVGTSAFIILTNILIICIWAIGYRCGLSITGQLYLVILLGLIFVPGFYYGLRACQKRQNRIWQFMRKIGNWTHWECQKGWTSLQHLIDHLA